MLLYNESILSGLKLFLITALVFASGAAEAAQWATIHVDQAPIRERPALDAKIIETVEGGKKIRVSSFNKDGWYKVKASIGQMGWVWQGDLFVETNFQYLDANPIDKRPRPLELRGKQPDAKYFLRAGGNFFLINSGELSKRLGLGGGYFYNAFGGFIEAQIKVGNELRLAVRAMQYSGTEQVKYFTVAYDVTHEGSSFLVGLEKDVSHGESFDFSGAVYLGYSFSNKMTVKAVDFPAPNSFELTGSSFAFLVNFSGRYFFNRWLCGVLEGGLYFSQQASQQIGSNFNADDPFRDDGSRMASLRVNHIGPLFGLGLQVQF